LLTSLKLFWTTRDGFDPVADWRRWLETNVGKEKEDWMWAHWDVVAGDTDERTIIALVLPNEAALLFLLSNEYELYVDNSYPDW
jgi:hypothetical protein